MTTAATGITAPADLAGRTIATAEGSASETLLPAYARAAGFDAATVKTRPTELNGLMARREADAISTSVLGEEALRTASKQRVVVMPFSDHLGNLYGNVIITRADLITEDPGLVSRFTTAALRGQKYTLDHPDEAAALLETTDPAAAGEIKTMMRYVSPHTAEPIGFLDQRRVAASIADLEAAGLIPAGLTPTALADFSFVTGP
jgi:NitT/TauT family transport system substrate-binding protein